MLVILTVLGVAQAGVTVGPALAVVGSSGMALRPGLRVGFEPTPEAALEIIGDSTFSGEWDLGAALAGRLYLSPRSPPGVGLYGLGRLTAGLSGEDQTAGPWTGLSLGFGARPSPQVGFEASFGPEWAMAEGPRWRTELGICVVFDGSGGARRGRRHHPRPIP